MEIIKLNLIPSGVNPTCHCSQYDEGRVIRIELFDGLTPYTLQSGDTVTLNVRKPDNTIVTTSVTATQGNNYVDIVTTEQICACVGYNLCDLTITNGSVVIGTLNFIMAIERDVLADGIPSQSVIEDLDELVQEAVGDNYYTKTETDTALALKADKSELYNVYPTEQESGAIAHFTDGADNIPVKSLVSQIVATGGGGTPDAPIAISGFDSGAVTRCGKNLFSYDLTIRNGYWTDDAFVGDNAIVPKENAVTWQYIRVYVEGLSSITLSGFDNQGGTNCAWLSSENVNDVISRFNSLNKNGTKTVPSGAKYLCLTIYNIKDRITTNPNAQLEIGNQATTFEAFNDNTYSFNFGQTVYGGYFDNKGNLVVTHGIVDLGSLFYTRTTSYGNAFFYGALTAKAYSSCKCGIYEEINATYASSFGNNALNYQCACNVGGTQIFIRNDDYTDANAFKTAMNGVMLVYELATPITLSITSQDIPTLLGENNIFSNTGDVDVTIRADIGLYIDKRLNTTRSTPTLSLSKDNSTLSETQVKYEDPIEEVKDPVEESEDNNEER